MVRDKSASLCWSADLISSNFLKRATTGRAAGLMVGNLAVGLPSFAVEQRFATGKAILDAVPVVDVRFADLPTEENHFRAQHPWKIDQTLFDPLANATIAIDLIDPTLHLPD